MPVTGPHPGELLDRFLARLIDMVLVGIVNFIVVSVVIVGILFGTGGGTPFSTGGGFIAGAVGAILGAAISLGYFGVMESQRGQTVGKMLLKLHVEGPDGGHPTLEQAIKRNIWVGISVLGIVPILGSLVALLGELVAIIMIAVGINSDTVRRQPWTDKFAGTQVIKEGPNLAG